MDKFTGAWSTVEQKPTLTEPCEEDYPLSTQYADSAFGFNEDEWDPFLKTLGHDTSTARSTFQLASLTPTTENVTGVAPVTALPLITPWSSTSSGSSILTPPNSATEPPVLTFNAPVTSNPQVPSTLWTYPPLLPGSQFGNFSHAGLGIHFPNSINGNGLHNNLHAGHVFDQRSQNPVASIEREHPSFFPHSNQQSSYYGGSIEDDDESETDVADPCYAKLLWTCLKEAPGHTMSLKDLYEWVQQNSEKAKDPKTRGWQNSVRHNLSMNAAFERVTSPNNQGAKKGSLWRLTDKALREGVISTTRYRKDPKRKPERRGHPALKRQISGAKGGQATRASTRRQHGLQHVRSMPYLSHTDGHIRSQCAHYEPTMSAYSPHFSGHSPQLLMTPLSQTSPYHLGMDEDNSLPILPSDTPPQVTLGYAEEAKPALSNFGYHHVDISNGLFFSDQDDGVPGTPSMGTEASFINDECIPELQMSRETTIF